MTLATPPPGSPVSNTQIDAWINLCNSALQSVTLTCSSTPTLSTTETLVPGCSVAVTTVGASSYAIVTGFFDFSVSATSAGNIMIGRCQFNGIDQPAGLATEAHLQDNGLNTRGTPGQSWKVPLGTQTAGVIRLMALKLASGGTHVANGLHTTMTVQVYDLA